jgi:cellulose synthase/poly-beta-1,6-N-acetylglucosamine synthase-like glycosyltransferase
VVTPSVCVVTNMFNEAAYLRNYLDSLSQQTYSQFRFLLVDDGSTDGSTAIAERYRHRLDLELVALPHVGLQYARAAAFDWVTEDICVVLDADEVLFPDCVQKLLEPFADPRVGATGGVKLPMGQRPIANAYRVINGTTQYMRTSKNGDTQWVVGGCLAVRMEAVRGVGGITRELSIGEDVDLSWRLKRAGWRLVMCNDARVYHREPGSLWEVWRLGSKAGRRSVETFARHPQQARSWKFWSRFTPLFLLIAGLRWPKLAIAGLCTTFVGSLYLFRVVDAPFHQKALAWAVFTLENLAWSIGYLAELAAVIQRRTAGRGS